MDGEHEDIPGHFKKKYHDLFNCVDDAVELKKVEETLKTKKNFFQSF